MPIKRPQFVNNEIYHIIVRGIEKRNIFLDEKDYLRFIYDIYEFNDEDIVINVPYYFNNRQNQQNKLFAGRRSQGKARKLLVEVLCFCLMPNHFHLLVRQLRKGGISLLMQKLGGYPTYFNKKYNRVGSLFQRPFRAVHIKTEDQLMVVACYIHMNPIDIIEPGWKERGISNPKKAIKFIESYRWSSYSDYLEKRNFPSVTNRKFIDQVFDGPKNLRKFVNSRIFYKTKLANFIESLDIPSIE